MNSLASKPRVSPFLFPTAVADNIIPQTLVSIIVPTKNSAATLEKCLQSIKNQKYPLSEVEGLPSPAVILDLIRNPGSALSNDSLIELIVVDNNSTDNTKEIAKKFTDKVFTRGPERSAQTNFGVTQARGKYVYKVDSDFVLDPHVVAQCLQKIENEAYDAVIVHNSPDIRVSWIAKIRKFEVDMYKYDLTHSSARFIKKEVYQKIGGYNEHITAGEDYDFQNKLNRGGYKTGFIDAEALHLGEPTSFWKHMKKYYDYGRDFVNYQQQNKAESKQQLGFFRSVYFKHWKKFLIHPILGIGFILYNICKYGFGGVGYVVEKFFKK